MGNVGSMKWTAGLLAVAMWPASAAAAADGWQRDGRDLLRNFNNMYNPCVVETPGPYRYKMWFFGWAARRTNPGVPGCDAIFHAPWGQAGNRQ